MLIIFSLGWCGDVEKETQLSQLTESHEPPLTGLLRS